jgi:hypothetical protein
MFLAFRIPATFVSIRLLVGLVEADVDVHNQRELLAESFSPALPGIVPDVSAFWKMCLLSRFLGLLGCGGCSCPSLEWPYGISLDQLGSELLGLASVCSGWAR